MALEPITRTEKLMAGQQLEPITRKELFLAKAAGMDVKTPEPITREEMFLNMITGGGGGTPGGGGGSTASVPWNDVTFIDYDGTVLHSYTLEETQALTELPPLPEQKGLICQGWNWSLEDIKAQKGPVIVGAMYITDDGKTRIYITLPEGRTSPMLGVCVNGTVTVDWGDGTEPDVVTGATTSYLSPKWTPTHEYASAGDYVISLSVEGELLLGGSGQSTAYSYILRCTSGQDNRNDVYRDFVKKIEIGNGVKSIGPYAFRSCPALASVSIPNSITSIGEYALSSCRSLVSVSIPNSVASIGQYGAAYNTGLVSVSFPLSIKSIGNYILYGDSGLEKVTIPNSVTSIGTQAFRNITRINKVTIPNSVTSIGTEAFGYCRTRYYDFSAYTSVPALGNSTAFAGIFADCQMLIPSALYDEWSAATNWTTYASYMVAV